MSKIQQTSNQLENKIYSLDLTKFNMGHISLHTEQSFIECINRLDEKYKNSEIETKIKIRRIKRFLYSQLKEYQESVCENCNDQINLKIK